MEEDSGVKMLVKNESDKDRIIRAVVAVVLIAFYFAVPSSVNATIANVGLVVAGVLLFNAVSGTCMIYRAFGINTCPVKSTE